MPWVIRSFTLLTIVRSCLLVQSITVISGVLLCLFLFLGFFRFAANTDKDIWGGLLKLSCRNLREENEWQELYHQGLHWSRYLLRNRWILNRVGKRPMCIG
jgi:hypothetical protein